MITFLLLEFILNLLKSVNIKKINLFIENNFITELFYKEIVDFKKCKKSEYKSILINDVKQIHEMYFESIFNIIFNILKLVISIIVLLLINITGTIVVVILSFLPVLMSLLIQKLLGKKINSYISEKTVYTKNINELLDGHDTMTLYGSESFVIEKHDKLNENESETKKGAFIWIEALSSIVSVSAISVTILTLIVGMYLAINGHITIGQIFALSFISNGISSPLMLLSDQIPKFLGGKVFINKYNNYLNNSIIAENKKSEIEIRNNILLNNVSFSDNIKILDKINLNFKTGKKYLIIGESGSGKSTVLKTILGQANNYSGLIRYDETDLATVSDQAIYNNITYIEQNHILFRDTIKNNITLFSDEISDDKIYEILDFVNMKEFVMNLPEKLDYILNETQSNLSGGEKQRLLIARAILYTKSIIIMDEATSDLIMLIFKILKENYQN